MTNRASSILTSILITALLFSTITQIATATQTTMQTTVVSIKPAQVAIAVGQSFTVDINVTDVTDLFGYNTMIWYRNDVLQGISAVRPAGHFLEPIDPSNQYAAKWQIKNDYNATHGRIWLSFILLLPETGRTGSGILARLTFKGIKGGLTPVTLNPADLVDSNGTPIPCVEQNGSAKVGTIITVPDDFPTIQGAINNANNGSTVFVRAGIYDVGNINAPAMVVVNKTVSLIGENRDTTVIDGKYAFASIIYVKVDNVTIRGFTIQNSNYTTSLDGGGVFINYSKGNRIENNMIRNTQYGVNLRSASSNLIIDNVIVIEGGYPGGNGMEISESTANNTIFHNFFINSPLTINNGESQIWNSSYPAGGNYWDYYSGSDEYSGPYQNETGSDGIGDVPLTLNVNNQDNYPLMGHDVKVTKVTPNKTAVGQGFTLNINVTVKDYGTFANIFDILTFDVTVYCNSTLIASQTVSMTSKGMTTLTFTWNTASFAKGNYTISAYATPVPGEVYPADNRLANGSVFVGMPGDIAAQYGIIDIFDITTVDLAFGSVPSEPNWNPIADITNNGVVDIFDIVIVALHFGETEP